MPDETPLYVVISLNHTMRSHKAITLWMPNDQGYCWTLELAGRYLETNVLDHLGYYNSGCANIAVPLDLVERLACEVEYNTEEFGRCVPNNAESWRRLLASVIRPTNHPARPEYKGARYPKAA